MTLLRDFSETQPSSVKAGLFGDSGSGKTLTSGLLALGLSVKLHDRAPVCMADAENAARFLEPIYRTEGVRLFAVPSHSFIDMRDGLAEATEQKCCAYIVDNYTAAHAELGESAKAEWGAEGRQMPYPLREELNRLWSEWVRTFRDSPLHVLLNGRLGYTWDEVEDETGDPHFVKLGTKMRGERDMGYEPDLLIEMDAIREKLVRNRRTKTKSGHMLHAAVILKDRWRELNGKTFVWKDLNSYAKGDFEGVCRDFWPHVIAQTSGSSVVRGESVARTSRSLFAKPSGESAFAERQRRVEVALGEIDGTIDLLWPSANGTDDKRLRAIVRKMLFGVRSEAAIKALLPETLEAARAVVALFESSVTDPSQAVNVKDEAQVIALLQVCLDSRRELTEATVM